MSSSILRRGWRTARVGGCVGDHGSMDDVGKSPFQCSECFFAGVAVVRASLDEGDRFGMVASLGECNAMESGVELTVSGSAESVALAVA